MRTRRTSTITDRDMSTRTEGNRRGIERRWQGDDLDEIVADAATVHIERMNDSEYFIGIYTRTHEGRFFIGARRAPVKAMVMDVTRLRRQAARRQKGRGR